MQCEIEAGSTAAFKISAGDGKSIVGVGWAHGRGVKAPLLPVAIINSHRVLGTGRGWPRLLPVALRIGEPIPAPTGRKKPELEATTRELQRRINALIDQGVGNP